MKPVNKIRTAAVIPFFNEEKTVNTVINSVLHYADYVIAVNDGSTDKSLNSITASENIHIINLPANQGKGSALKAGLQKSIEMNFVYAVTLDADMQHDPSFIPYFVKAAEEYDIVIGNRLNDLSDMPLQRILSNRITSYLLSVKTGMKIIDSQSGYRIFRTEILEKILPTTTGFEAESEMIIKAARNSFRIGFVGIPTVYGNEESKIRPVRTIFNFIKVLLLK